MVRRTTPKIDRLIARLKNATRGHGDKTMLARKLGVHPQRLNDWLSGTNVPGGEVVLRMLEWVTAQEAQFQQTKRAGSALTRPALKTRKSKSTTNEKAKSGLSKKP
jgi:transcriptional regulator with XRE-family HTH domain